MAKNTGSNYRQGAVKSRSQFNACLPHDVDVSEAIGLADAYGVEGAVVGGPAKV